MQLATILLGGIRVAIERTLSVLNLAHYRKNDKSMLG